MSSLLCSTGPLIQVGVRSVQVRARTLRHDLEVDSMIRSFMPVDAVGFARMAVSNIADDNKRLSVTETMLRTIRRKCLGVSLDQRDAWLGSFEGRLFRVWQSIRNDIPRYDDVVEIICEEIDNRGFACLREIESAIDSFNAGFESDLLYEIRNIVVGNRTAKFSDGRVDELIHRLCNEPYFFPIEHVLDMTYRQIGVVLRDPDGDERSSEPPPDAKMDARARRVHGLHWDPKYKLLASNIAGGKHLMDGLMT